jgi:predicted metalloprotease with PDZ domain
MFPPSLGRFDYTREAYTRCLWVVEGLTSYYDRATVRLAGRLPIKRYFEKLADEWSRLLATPGRARQSLEEASFDAWIKLYKPDESNLNTTVSYYLKGGLVALALDLAIRRRSSGQRSLDDVARALWREYGASGRPYPEDVQPIFEAATGLELGDFFDRFVRGREDPDLVGELAAVGLTLRETMERPPGDGDNAAGWLGVMLASGGGCRVASVFDGSPAAAAGLSPGDDIIAISGYRVSGEADVRARLRAWTPGARVTITVFRRERLTSVEVELAPAPPNRVEIAAIAEPPPAARGAFEAWMGAPALETGVIAASPAARWT